MNNKKLVKVSMSVMTADEAVVKLFHPKYAGEACCTKQEDDVVEEPIEVLCYECYNTGWTGGYDFVREIEAVDVEITQQVIKHQETSARLEFDCAFWNHVYCGCLLWLDQRGWEVVDVEQDVAFVSPDFPVEVPTNWHVTARSLSSDEIELHYLERYNEQTKEST